MSKIFAINNKLVMVNNSFIGPYVPPPPPPPPPPPTPSEVIIGTQVWATTNLAYDDGGSGIVKVDSVTYTIPDYTVEIGPQYYYTYDAAVRLANAISGWHVPTQTEWGTLIDWANQVAGGSGAAIIPLGARWKWYVETTDATGFGALPTGRYYTDSQELLSAGVEGNYRASDSSDVYCLFTNQHVTVYNSTGIIGPEYMSVRLIKDSNV